MKTITPISSSFRDPGGFVFHAEELFFRAVKKNYTEAYIHLMNSGLYTELVEKKLLISHEEIDNFGKIVNGFFKVLKPDQISFISYPYEWCFNQWKDVLIAFIEINKISLKYGMILQDATPFNFTFHKGRPIFLDTISFIFYKDGSPWKAYRQFCESMLGPFALIKYNGSNWVRQFSTFINGADLNFISKALPLKSYCNMVFLLHIHLHSRYQSHKNNSPKKRQEKGLNSQKLNLLLTSIGNTIDCAYLNSTGKSFWSSYYKEEILSQQYLFKKVQLIENWIKGLPIGSFTDLGANTGMFTLLAGQYAKEVIAIESDPDCVCALYEKVKKENRNNIIVVQADLMQPSPGLGWNNEERQQLIKRIKGDTILALALIHHLCIVNNLPIAFFASFIASITNKYAIVEFVSRTDPMVVNMLHLRDLQFPEYNEEVFSDAFEKHFTLIQKYTFSEADRSIYLWEKK